MKFKTVFLTLPFIIKCCYSSCSQVFVDQLTSKDMEFIGDSIFPSIDKEIIAKMVEFSNRVTEDCWVLESFLFVKCDDTI